MHHSFTAWPFTLRGRAFLIDGPSVLRGGTGTTGAGIVVVAGCRGRMAVGVDVMTGEGNEDMRAAAVDASSSRANGTNSSPPCCERTFAFFAPISTTEPWVSLPVVLTHTTEVPTLS